MAMAYFTALPQLVTRGNELEKLQLM